MASMGMWPARGLRLLGLGVLALTAACPLGVQPLQANYPCETDADCVDDYVCSTVEKVCVQTTLAPEPEPDTDGGEPDVPPDDGGEPDVPPDDAGVDGGATEPEPNDGGEPEDAGSDEDAGTPADDAGTPVDDAGAPVDAGVEQDAGPPPNQAPVVQDDVLVVDEDGEGVVQPLDNDVDPDGDDLAVTEVTPAGNGEVVLVNRNEVHYAPHADFYGADSFTVTVEDGEGGATTSTVTVTINPMPDAPVGEDHRYFVMPGGTFSGTCAVQDVDADPLTFLVVDAPNQGTFTFDDVTGDFTYVADDNAGGTDSFRCAGLDDTSVGVSAVTVVIADKRWTGAVSTDVGEDDNWEPTGVPGASDVVLVDDMAAQMPVLDTDREWLSLAVVGAASFDLAQLALDLSDGFVTTEETPGVHNGEVVLIANAEVEGAVDDLVIEGNTEVNGSLHVRGNLESSVNLVLNVRNGDDVTVDGDMIIEMNTANRGLRVEDGGHVLVKGTARFEGYGGSATQEGVLVGGVLELQGGLVQTSRSGGTRGLRAGDILIEFTGPAVQEVSFNNPDYDESRLRNVRVREGAHVVLTTPMVVRDTVLVESGATLEGVALHVHNDFPQHFGTYDVDETRVVRTMNMTRDVRLGGGELLVPLGVRVDLSGHSLEVMGNLTRISNTNGNGIYIDDDTSRLEVHGDVLFEGRSGLSNTVNHFTAGEMHLWGDFTQVASTSNQQRISGTHLYFHGQSTVTYDTDDGRTVHDVTVLDGAAVQAVNFPVVEGQFAMEGDATFAAEVLQFTNALPWTTAGYAVTYTEPLGDANTYNAAVVHGSIRVPRYSSLRLRDGHVVVKGDFEVLPGDNSDGLFMQDSSVVLDVEGDFIHDIVGSATLGNNHLSQGVLRLHGNLLEVSGGFDGVMLQGTELRFAGTQPQSVTLDNSADDDSRFDDVVIEPGADVTFATPVYVTGALVVQSGGALGGDELVLTSTAAMPETQGTYNVVETRVDGDLRIDRDGGAHIPLLVVPTYSQLRCNSRAFVLDGNLESRAITNSDGLHMQSPCFLDVTGDVTFVGTSGSTNTDGRFSQGHLRVGGDFTETTQSGATAGFESTGTIVSFSPGAHLVEQANPTVNNSRFFDLVVPTGASITLVSPVLVRGQATLNGTVAGEPLRVSDHLPATDGTVDVIVEVVDDISMTTSRALTVPELVVTENGRLNLNGRTLDVNGDFTNVEGVGGGLRLASGDDVLTVMGATTFSSVSTYSTSGDLSNGEMRLLGNVEQTGGSNALIVTGTHVIFMAGPARTLTVASSSTAFDDVTVQEGADVSLLTDTTFDGFDLAGTFHIGAGLSLLVDDFTLRSTGELNNSGTLTYTGDFTDEGGVVTGNAPVLQ